MGCKGRKQLVTLVLATLLCIPQSFAYAGEYLIGYDSGGQSSSVLEKEDGSAVESEPSKDGQEAEGEMSAEDGSLNGDADQGTEKSDSESSDSLANGTADNSEPSSGDDAVGRTEDCVSEAISPELEKVESPLNSGKYVIQSALAGGRVVDIASGSLADGGNVQIWAYNASAAQSFAVTVGDDGWCTISNVGSGKLLDVAWGKAFSGANVHQYDSNGSSAQKWRIVSDADGGFVIESALASGFALDVSGAGDFDGANVQLFAANGSKAQRFYFHKLNPLVETGDSIEEGVYSLSSVHATGKSVDISGASLSNGAPVQIYANNGTLAQLIKVEATDDGYYALRALHSGKALDVANGGILPGAAIQQWSFSPNNNNQKWSFMPNEDGSVTLISKANGLALDVQWGGTANGTPLQTYTINGSNAQKWILSKVDSPLKDGVYDIRSNLGSRRVLDVASCSPSSGANVQSWSWNGTPAQRFKISRVSGSEEVYTIEALCSGLFLTQKGSNVIQSAWGSTETLYQQWEAVPAASGGFAFVSKASGLALDISGGGNYDGCNVGVYELNGTPAQSFVPEATNALGEGTYAICSKADGRALDVSSGSRADGANVQVWAANGTGAQTWNIRHVGNGWYVVENARSGKALDVKDFGTASGTNVQQWQSSLNDAQKWRIEYAGNGGYRFVSACGGLCLDVAGGGGYDGCNVQVYTGNGTKAQSFRLAPTTYVKEKTLGDVLGVSRERIVQYLGSHAFDNYYLGSKYPVFEGDFGPLYNMCPNGNPRYDGYVGMNCAGFVAHAFQSAGGNTSVVQRYGALCGASFWYDCARANGTTIYSYRSINELLAGGQLQKGDLIYFYPSSWGISGADTHIGFFWGDYSFSNRFWHSDGYGNRISGITGIISSNTVYLIKV